MATRMNDVLTVARARLREFTPRAWTDQELLDIANLGIKDLWRRINDLYLHHFLTTDRTNCTLQANEDSISGLQNDVFRIVTIRPKVVGASNPNPSLIFKPARGLNDPRFIEAEARGAIAPRDHVIWYVVVNEGAPIGPPTVLVAPQISSPINLLVRYNHTLSIVDEDDNNPIPGESDNALVAWIVAYARGDERDDRAPDPEWLAIYGTEKTNLIKELGPRQIQEPDVVEGMWEDGALDG